MGQNPNASLMIDFQHLVAQLLLQAAKLDGGGGALLSALALDLLHFVQGIDERGIRRADGLDIHHAAFGFLRRLDRAHLEAARWSYP